METNTLSAQQLETMGKKIETMIRDYGYCSVPSLAFFVKNEMKVDWKKTSEGKNFPDWVCGLLPQYRRAEDDPNHLTALEAGEVPAAMLEKLMAGIDQKIADQGYCFCASLGGLIPWKDYQRDGENFSSFLKRILPGGYHIAMQNNALAVFAGEGETAQKPRKTLGMQEGVFAFAFIPQSAELNRSIQELTGDETITAGLWRDAVISAIGHWLLAEENRLYEDEGRLAFPLDLDSPRTVYAILEPNTPGQRQAWRLSGFSYPGCEEEAGWGKWLCSAFRLPSENRTAIASSMGALEETLDQTRKVREEASGRLEDLTGAILGGRPVDAGAQEVLHRYFTLWERLKAAAASAFLEFSADAPMSLETITEALQSKSDVAGQLKEVTEHFTVLCRGVWQYLGTSGLCAHADAGAERDCGAWAELCAGGRDSLPRLRAYMEAFSAFAKLAHPVTDLSTIPELEAPKAVVETHFGITISPMDLMSRFIMASQLNSGAFDFLGEIPHVEHLLEVAELSATQDDSARRVTQRAAESRAAGPDLLRQVLADARPVASILAAFPAPTALECAVMEGDFETASNLLGDLDPAGLESMKKVGDSLSPYYAGLRLALVMKNRNRQAERCFLTALAIGNTNGAQGLSIIYSGEERWEELELLLDYAKAKGLTQLVPRITEKLLEVGRSDFRTAARTNALLVLDPKYSPALQAQDSELYAAVQTIEEAASALPFVRYVVYHDDQLRDFILLEDNIAELNRAGISRSGEELLRLVQTGNYPKTPDALSVAQRCYAFLGDWRGLPELFLGMVPPDSRTRSLLFKIAKDRGDSAGMLEILEQDSTLREKKAELYKTLLFEAGAYDKFLAMEDAPSVRRMAAELLLGIWDGTLPAGAAPEDFLCLRDLLDGPALETVSAAALAANDVCLAYYTAENPDEDLTDLVRQRVRSVLADLDSDTGTEAGEAELHRLEVLCPRITGDFEQQLLMSRVLRNLRTPAGDGGSVSLAALIADAADAETVGLLLETLEARREPVDGDVTRALLTACGRTGCTEQWVRFCHKMGLFDPELLTDAYVCLLCGQGLPEDLAGEAERACRRWMGSTHDLAAAFCLLLLEEHLGRREQTLFALNYLEPRLDALSEEEKAAVRSRLDGQEARSELDLLRDLLTRDPGGLPDYLDYCAAFGLYTDEDGATGRTITRSYATELEAGALLHLMYRDYPSVSSVKAAIKLPLYDYPQLHARLIMTMCDAVSDVQCQSEAQCGTINELWRHCAGYCTENALFVPLVQTLLSWAGAPYIRDLQAIKWYHVKDLFASIDRLCGVSWTPEDWESAGQAPGDLTDRLVHLFGRFNSISDGDANHNSLRTIVHFAIASRSEARILDSNIVASAIYGPYKKLAFVLAIRMLVSGEEDRMDMALEILGSLDRIGESLPWHWLVHQLLGMDRPALKDWLAGDVGRCLIDLALPDGNEVNEEKLSALVMRYVNRDDVENGISVLNMLLREKDDCMVYSALFVLSKDAPLQKLPLMYRALCGMAATYPTANGTDRTGLFSRRRLEMVRLATVARAAMVRLGLRDQASLEGENPQFFRDLYAYGASSAWRGMDIADFVRDQQSFYDRIMRLYEGSDPELVTLALGAYVSGNWVPFLESAWESHRDHNLRPLFAPCCARGTEAELPNLGLKRSCLLLMKRMTQAERISFARWLRSFAAGADNPLPRLYSICGELSIVAGDAGLSEKAMRFYDIDSVNEEFLALPMEEHFVCIGTWNNVTMSEAWDAVDRREVHSCFDWLRSHTPPSRLTCTLNLYFSLAQDQTVGAAVTRYAHVLFGTGRDEYAQPYYDVLHYAATGAPYRRAQKICGVSLAKKPAAEQDAIQKQWGEVYQSRTRISGAFTGVEPVLSKLSSRNMHPHSVFNMVMELMSTSRRGELHSLCRFFHTAHRRLAFDLLKCVCSDVSDEEKLQIRMAYEPLNGTQLGAYELLTFLLSRKTTDAAPARLRPSRDMGYGSFVYLTSPEAVDRLRKEYDALCISRKLPVLLWPGMAYTAAQLQQTEAAPSLDSEDPGEMPAASREAASAAEDLALPAFAQEAGYVEGPQDRSLQELQDAYAGAGFLEYEKRLDLSRAIFLALRDSQNEKELTEALVTFGLNYYTFHRSGAQGSSPELADKALRELALWVQRRTVDRRQAAELASAVSTALIRILGSFETVDALVADFAANLNSYAAMVGLADAQHLWLSDLVNILSSLTRKVSKLGPREENEEAYRTLYDEVAEQLLSFNTERSQGRDVKNKLHRIVHAAINELQNRPDLTLTVLSRSGRGLPNDAVFGEVFNASAFPIESVTLVFSWSDGTRHTSNEYSYTDLQPQTRVAFRLEYKAEGSVVNYTISITALAHGKPLNIAPSSGSIIIEAAEGYDIENDFYTANKSIDFYEENGEIVPTSGFYGREAQMATLRKNVSPEQFSRGNNQLVRGRRRSGKTSLLKYFMAYCRCHCTNAIPIFVDCQGKDVASVFVTPVLNYLSLDLPELAGQDAWARFEQRWRGDADAGARVGEFFEELNLILDRLCGGERKGVYLVIDEFAVLLESLEKDAAVRLLQNLRAVMEHCGQTVKFTFCSSNQILKYKGKDGPYSQFFQSFQVENGTEIIVDDLTAVGIREMLTKPCQGLVEIPPYTLEWFYRYTGGLVWYTKLLGNAVLKRVCDSRRRIVYPSDVVEAFPGICNPNNCDVFYEGCSDDERLLISALADMLPNYHISTVGVSERDILASNASLKQMTGGAFKNAMGILHALNLVDSPNGSSEMHRFNKEIYRRYFRSRKLTPTPTASDTFTLKAAVSSADLYGGLSFFNKEWS